MSNLTVIIDCDEQGNYSVGAEPPESGSQASADTSGGEGGAQDQGEGQIQMQAAKNLDDALAQAKALFEQASSGNNDAAQKAFEGGFQGTMGPQAMGSNQGGMA